MQGNDGRVYKGDVKKGPTNLGDQSMADYEIGVNAFNRTRGKSPNMYQSKYGTSEKGLAESFSQDRLEKGLRTTVQ